MDRLAIGLLLGAFLAGCATPTPSRPGPTPVGAPIHGIDIPVVSQRGQGPDQIAEDVDACRAKAAAYAASQRNPTALDGTMAVLTVLLRGSSMPPDVDPDLPAATADPTNAAGVAFKRCMTPRGYEVRWAPTPVDTGGEDRAGR